MKTILLLVCVTLTGCAHHLVLTPEKQLKARAAFEFRCPDASLSVTSFGPTMAGVEGCNRRDVYVYSGGVWLLSPAPAVQTPSGGVGVVVPNTNLVIVP
jgi:hypothetical protein